MGASPSPGPKKNTRARLIAKTKAAKVESGVSSRKNKAVATDARALQYACNLGGYSAAQTLLVILVLSTSLPCCDALQDVRAFAPSDLCWFVSIFVHELNLGWVIGCALWLYTIAHNISHREWCAKAVVCVLEGLISSAFMSVYMPYVNDKFVLIVLGVDLTVNYITGFNRYRLVLSKIIQLATTSVFFFWQFVKVCWHDHWAYFVDNLEYLCVFTYALYVFASMIVHHVVVNNVLLRFTTSSIILSLFWTLYSYACFRVVINGFSFVRYIYTYRNKYVECVSSGRPPHTSHIIAVKYLCSGRDNALNASGAAARNVFYLLLTQYLATAILIIIGRTQVFERQSWAFTDVALSYLGKSVTTGSSTSDRMTTLGLLTGIGAGTFGELIVEEILLFTIKWSRANQGLDKALALRDLVMSILRASRIDGITQHVQRFIRMLVKKGYDKTVVALFNVGLCAPNDPLGSIDYDLAGDDMDGSEPYGPPSPPPTVPDVDNFDSFEAQSADPTMTFMDYTKALTSIGTNPNTKHFVSTFGAILLFVAYVQGNHNNIDLEQATASVANFVGRITLHTDLLASAHRVLMLVTRCLGEGSFSPLFMTTTRMQRWFDEANDWVITSHSSEANPSLDTNKHVIYGNKLITEGVALKPSANMCDGKTHVEYAKVMRSLTDAVTTFSAKYANATDRMEPIGVIITGPPAIGKSSVIEVIHRATCAVNDHIATDGDGSKWVFSGDTKYCDGLKSGVLTVVLDDIGKILPSSKLSEVAIQYIIGIINTVSWIPNMAVATVKGCIIFRPDTVVATTNTLHMNAAQYFACPNAIWRRFPWVVKPTVKQHLRLDHGDANSRLDPVKITRADYIQGLPNLHDYEIQRVVIQEAGRPIYEHVTTFSDAKMLYVWYYDMLVEKKKQFTDKQANLVSVAHSSFCKRCLATKMPLVDHVCEGLQGQVEIQALSENTRLLVKFGIRASLVWLAAMVFVTIYKAIVLGLLIYIAQVVFRYVFSILDHYLSEDPNWAVVLEIIQMYHDSVLPCVAYCSGYVVYTINKLAFRWLLWQRLGDPVRAINTYNSALRVQATALGHFVYGVFGFLNRSTHEQVARIRNQFNVWLHADMLPTPQFVARITCDKSIKMFSALTLVALLLLAIGFFSGRRRKVQSIDDILAAGVQSGGEPTGFTIEKTEKLQNVWSNLATARKVVAVNTATKTMQSHDFIAKTRDITAYLEFTAGDKTELVHGVWLRTGVLLTVRHALEAVTPHHVFSVRVMMSGLMKTYMITKNDVYYPDDSPEVALLRIATIEKRDLTCKEKTLFIGAGTDATMPVTIYPTEYHRTQYEAIHGVTDVPREFGGTVVTHKATVAGLRGDVGVSKVSTKTLEGHCGLPLVASVSGQQRAIVGIHVGALTNATLGTCAVFIPTPYEKVVSWVNAADIKWGQSTFHAQHMQQPPIFQEGDGPLMPTNHHLSDKGINSPLQAKWLYNNPKDPHNGFARVVSYGTIVDWLGQPLNSGFSKASAVQPTPWADFAAGLGYATDKVAPRFTQTCKTRAIRRIDSGHRGFPRDLLDICAAVITKSWHEKINEQAVDFVVENEVWFGTGPLSLDVAINGIEGNTYFDRMNPKTSAGYPWCKPKNKVNTSTSDGTRTTYSLPKEALERIHYIEKAYDESKPSGVVFHATFKDEPISEKKRDIHKVRVIYAAPQDLVAMMRMVFGAFIVHMQQFPSVYGCYLGSNPESHMWTHLAKRIKARKWCFDGDHSGYDTLTFNKDLPTVVGKMIVTQNLYLNRYRFDEQQIDAIRRGLARKGLDDGRIDDILQRVQAQRSQQFTSRDVRNMWGTINDTTSPFVNFWGDMAQVESLNPSGQLLTTVDNSFANVLLHCCAYVITSCVRDGVSWVDQNVDDLSHRAQQFVQNVDLVTFGDDFIVATDDVWYTFEAFRNVMQQFGMVVTPADKAGDSYDFVEFERLTFLKRSFVWDPKHAVYRAPLDKAVISKMFLVWTKNDDSDMDHAASIFRAISIAASQHTEEYFNEVHDHIRLVVEHMGWDFDAMFPKRLPTYQQYVDRAYYGKEHDLTSDWVKALDMLQ